MVGRLKMGEFGKETKRRNGKITIGIYLAESDNNINWVYEITKEKNGNVGRQNLFSSELKEFLVILLQMEPQKGKENGIVGFARNERTGIMWLKRELESVRGYERDWCLLRQGDSDI